MGTFLKGGTLVELEPASVEVASLRIEEGQIVARGEQLVAQRGDEIIEAQGKLVLPGLISAHHHLYSTLLRGAARDGVGFSSEQAVLSRLEQSLDLDSTQAAAAMGGLEGLSSGTTTVMDLHASGLVIGDSLTRVARGLSEVGLRAVLGYGMTEHHGAVRREEALEETAAFIKRAKGRIRGAFCAYAADALSDEALSALRQAWEPGDALLHLHLGEDPLEEQRSVRVHGRTPMARLSELGLLGERTVVAQAVHLSWPELSSLLDRGAWIAHCPRSNMASQTGAASAAKFGLRGCLGTDTQPLDLWAEAQAAWLRARDSGQPIDVLRYLANGHRLASAAFGETIGPLQVGARADLVIYDYRPPTPFNAATLAQHVVCGLSARHVESVMVDGIWRLWSRKPLAVKPEDLARAAREAAEAVWARMGERAGPPLPVLDAASPLATASLPAPDPLAQVVEAVAPLPAQLERPEATVEAHAKGDAQG